MSGNRMRIRAAGLVALATLAAPAVGSAQGYGFDQPSIVVECGPGQRAVMEQRRINGRTQVVAACEPARAIVYDDDGRAIETRSATYDSYRAARHSRVQYVERAPRRSKTKSAMMIAGSAATGAGVGGALKGAKGALIGAAIGGGSASIYEATRRR